MSTRRRRTKLDKLYLAALHEYMAALGPDYEPDPSARGLFAWVTPNLKKRESLLPIFAMETWDRASRGPRMMAWKAEALRQLSDEAKKVLRGIGR